MRHISGCTGCFEDLIYVRVCKPFVIARTEFPWICKCYPFPLLCFFHVILFYTLFDYINLLPIICFSRCFSYIFPVFFPCVLFSGGLNSLIFLFNYGFPGDRSWHAGIWCTPTDTLPASGKIYLSSASRGLARGCLIIFLTDLLMTINEWINASVLMCTTDRT